MERLRGVNFGGWLSQLDAIEEKDPARFPGIDTHMKSFIDERDFRRVAKWGFNHVRLPVDYNYFFTDDAEPITSRIRHLDDAVSFAQANHLRIMIDLHKCPGHTFHDETKAVQQLFVEEAYVDRTLRIWAFLADRYGGFTNTIFEVLNEPVAPTAKVWDQLKNRLCLEVRKHAPHTPIVVGSNMWNWPSTYPDLSPVPDDNVMYSVHFYEPLLFTHQRAPWLPEDEFRRTRPYPGDYADGVVRQYGLVMSKGRWDKERIRAEFAPVLRFRDAHQASVLCNEFGTYVQAPREDHLRWLSDLLDVMREYDMGFSYWNYRNLDFGIFSKGEQLHENLPRYDNPERMDTALLELLRQG